jgi:hypothetical protein
MHRGVAGRPRLHTPIDPPSTLCSTIFSETVSEVTEVIVEAARAARSDQTLSRQKTGGGVTESRLSYTQGRLSVPHSAFPLAFTSRVTRCSF